jgi:hypothetical protein
MLVALLVQDITAEGSIMNTTARHGAAVVLLMLLVACGSSGPTLPTGTSQPPPLPSPTPPPAANFPPLSGPSRTFFFDRELSHPVSNYTKNSRFVLYDNGAFVLQYLSLGEGGYRGGYKDATASLLSSGRAGAAPDHGVRPEPSKVIC